MFLFMFLLVLLSCSAFGKYQDSLFQNAPVSNYESARLQKVNHSCPPWKFDKYQNSSCECGDKLQGAVICNKNQSTVLLLTCHCMSYSDYGDMTLVGICMYLCTYNPYTKVFINTDLNNLCNSVVQQNRKGQMCGKCLDNHSPAPYSYRLKCAQYSSYKYNWIKYLSIAFLPLTAFYVMVIFFTFNAMSPLLNAYIFFCQIMSCPTVMSILTSYV